MLIDRWIEFATPQWRKILQQATDQGDTRRAAYARWMLKEVLGDAEQAEPETGAEELDELGDTASPVGDLPDMDIAPARLLPVGRGEGLLQGEEREQAPTQLSLFSEIEGGGEK